MFNTVEGNSTFYGLPSLETVQRWCNETAGGFRFSMKFPRVISHDKELVGCDRELQSFLDVVETLAERERLGPTFLQLGPKFGPDRLFVLERFLDGLPPNLPWAVEVRHSDWYDQDRNEDSLKLLIQRYNVDKVLFDSRPLFQSAPGDDVEAAAQKRKPKTPVRQTVIGKHPMLRFIGRNEVSLCDRYIDQWAPIVARWIRDGREPYVFTHAPDDRFAPEIARRFWHRLCNELSTHAGDQSKASPEKPLIAKEESGDYKSRRLQQWKEQDLPSLAPIAKQPTLFDE